MTWTEQSSRAVDDTFRAFGKPATVGSVPCMAIVDTRDVDARSDDGRPALGQVTVEVRKSEIAAPAAGATVVVYPNEEARTAATGGTTYKVMSRPIASDPDGLVWTMWAK